MKNPGLLLSVPLSSHLSLIMAEQSCLPWFHPAWGGVHTWRQAWRQHDSWGNTPSFSQIKTHPPRQILMTSKTFRTKSAQPLTALTFDWQEGYPTLRPWSPPPLQLQEQIMSNMGEIGSLLCQMSKKPAPVQCKVLGERQEVRGEESSWANFLERGEMSEVLAEFDWIF